MAKPPKFTFTFLYQSQEFIIFSNCCLTAVKVHDLQAYRNMKYAVLKRIPGFEPSSETTAPRYLKLVTVPSIYTDLILDAISTVCHQFGFLNTDLHLMPRAGFVETFNQDF